MNSQSSLKDLRIKNYDEEPTATEPEDNLLQTVEKVVEHMIEPPQSIAEDVPIILIPKSEKNKGGGRRKRSKAQIESTCKITVWTVKEPTGITNVKG
jgi:hypothetical protein